MKMFLLCILLNIVNFIMLYFIASYSSLLIFVIILYLIPVIINNFIFVKATKSRSSRIIFIKMVISSLISATAYSVFAFFFVTSPIFNDFVINNSQSINEAIQIEISEEFFSFSQVITLFVINFSILLLLNLKQIKQRMDYNRQEI